MTDQDKAPFNMALNTLERIGGILTDIHKTAADTMLSPAEKQFIMISHAKNFFSQASPLLNDKEVQSFTKKILLLRPKQNTILRTKSGMVCKEETQLIYDPDLDDKLFEFLIEVQGELQKLKFFMPPRKDLSRAVGSFN